MSHLHSALSRRPSPHLDRRHLAGPNGRLPIQTAVSLPKRPSHQTPHAFQPTDSTRGRAPPLFSVLFRWRSPADLKTAKTAVFPQHTKRRPFSPHAIQYYVDYLHYLLATGFWQLTIPEFPRFDSRKIKQNAGILIPFTCILPGPRLTARAKRLTIRLSPGAGIKQAVSGLDYST